MAPKGSETDGVGSGRGAQGGLNSGGEEVMRVPAEGTLMSAGG